MIKFIKISIGIFLVLSASRFFPHPPNFTSLIALSFYVPVFFGLKFLPILILSFLITDIIIGFHNTLIFTWGSIVLIGLISNYFKDTLHKRILGALSGAIIFFIITNFGVWTLGSYDYSLSGIVNCYLLAIPFFANTLISTLLFSLIIEFIIKIFSFEKKFKYH